MPAQNSESNNRTLKTLLVWSAPSRVFQKRDKEYFTTVISIAVLLAVILIFFKEWLLIMVISALVFVAIVMTTIPPENVEHKITNQGMVTGGKNYRWENLNRFWFSQKTNQKILFLETNIRFPGRLMMLLGEAKEEEVKKILSEYLTFEVPEKTWMDKAGDWLNKNIPLEK